MLVVARAVAASRRKGAALAFVESRRGGLGWREEGEGMRLAAVTQFLCGVRASGVQVRFGRWVMAFERSSPTEDLGLHLAVITPLFSS